MEHRLISEILQRMPEMGKYKAEKHQTDYNVLMELINAIGAKYEPKYEIKENQKKLYQNLCLYFTDNNKCEWDLTKGLMIHGKKGVGKSICMKIFKQIYFTNHLHNLLKPSKSFSIFNMEALSINDNKTELFKALERNLFCDEVFRETKSDDKIINNYGTKEQPFSVAIHSMYRNFCDKSKLYHFTTNYWNVSGNPNGEVFSQVYGSEIHDRIIEMCNIIEVKNEINGKSKSLRE
jgi:hypothetical protein